jgi:hypothetical protein
MRLVRDFLLANVAMTTRIQNRSAIVFQLLLEDYHRFIISKHDGNHYIHQIYIPPSIMLNLNTYSHDLHIIIYRKIHVRA